MWSVKSLVPTAQLQLLNPDALPTELFKCTSMILIWTISSKVHLRYLLKLGVIFSYLPQIQQALWVFGNPRETECLHMRSLGHLEICKCNNYHKNQLFNMTVNQFHLSICTHLLYSQEYWLIYMHAVISNLKCIYQG